MGDRVQNFHISRRTTKSNNFFIRITKNTNIF